MSKMAFGIWTHRKSSKTILNVCDLTDIFSKTIIGLSSQCRYYLGLQTEKAKEKLKKEGFPLA